MLSEEHNWSHNQVVKVDGVIGLKGSLVALVQHGDALLAGAVGCAYYLSGLQQAVFPVADGILGGVDQLFVELGVAHQQFFDQIAAVFLVENGEAGFKAQGFDLGADYGQAQIMKGADGEAGAIFFAQ